LTTAIYCIFCGCQAAPRGHLGILPHRSDATWL
jgi:hypothetical protein